MPPSKSDFCGDFSIANGELWVDQLVGYSLSRPDVYGLIIEFSS